MKICWLSSWFCCAVTAGRKPESDSEPQSHLSPTPLWSLWSSWHTQEVFSDAESKQDQVICSSIDARITDIVAGERVMPCLRFQWYPFYIDSQDALCAWKRGMTSQNLRCWLSGWDRESGRTHTSWFGMVRGSVIAALFTRTSTFDSVAVTSLAAACEVVGWEAWCLSNECNEHVIRAVKLHKEKALQLLCKDASSEITARTSIYFQPVRCCSSCSNCQKRNAKMS